ncbi:hypothetical protein [Clostridium novyi]|uniref:hypothetical protein n=1 Tax=Clostridium novyi TaxID=1542 RepID=UPI000A5BEA52|nr:hypothetical protein [Clostridium novyi]
MELINDIITIIAVMFFIPISIWFVKRSVCIIKNIKFFIIDSLCHIEKSFWNKIK